jgi:hypothetical protein
MDGDPKGIERASGMRPNRRELLKKALVLGPVAYTAPMVLGTATPVSAQGISGINPACVGATCVNFSTCNNNPNCVCFSLADGQGFCGTGVLCAGLAACSISSPCAAGFVCQVNTCCGAAGICVPISTACPAPGQPAAPAPAGSTSRVN